MLTPGTLSAPSCPVDPIQPELMYSLYHSLLAQHSRQLTPVRCAESTIAQLHRYFEDVVLENNLGALVIESLAASHKRSPREVARLRELGQAAQSAFFFITNEPGLSLLMPKTTEEGCEPVLLELPDQGNPSEHFVVIADARFSAVLASVSGEDDEVDSSGNPVIWTFEPDVVYSALEYLMARVTAEHPHQGAAFSKAVGMSMPKAASLQLTLGVTTKLARLLQAQAEREIAVNRIATAIRNSLELDKLLQTAANEVGRALNASCSVVRVEGDYVSQPMTKCYSRPGSGVDESTRAALQNEVDALSRTLSSLPQSCVVDGASDQTETDPPQAVVPLIYRGRHMGLLLVRSDDNTRAWVENELLLLHTVADQLTVAVKQVYLFSQMQQQALTDKLTECYNRRSFELQLEKDLHLATRNRQPLSLIMIDLDNFKKINDRAGHTVGDIALRILADTLRAELRGVDTAARFGGDEFAVILPQADLEGARIVAERLRARIEQTEVPGFGSMTASFGLATFPLHASARTTLVVAADQALYTSKSLGRNRVSLPPDERPSANETSPLEELDEDSILQRL